MGERLRARGARPGLVLASSAKRARSTARRLLEALGEADERISIEPKLYLAHPDEILEIVSKQNPDIDELMLVAHNPGLTDLANELLPDLGLANLPTSGIVAVDFDGTAWTGLRQCSRSLAYYDFPKNTAPAVSRTNPSP